jgi:hypothetical protein
MGLFFDFSSPHRQAAQGRKRQRYRYSTPRPYPPSLKIERWLFSHYYKWILTERRKRQY